MRSENRAENMLRSVEMIPNANPYAEGSCFIKCGNTHVMCTASVEEKVPAWIKGSGAGWITAEYGMLPRSTKTRMDRESKKGQSGRTQEIQRLIGRALRASVDLKSMPEISIKVDCDVIQADGGTRTASITGGYVALVLALKKLQKDGVLKTLPLLDSVSALSCGICGGVPCLDLDYEEDSSADTDSNFVITGSGKLVEIQGTAEHNPFSEDEFLTLLSLAKAGCSQLKTLQEKALQEA